MVRALVLLSGGQDSTTCLAYAIKSYGSENVYSLTIDYRQRHRKEVEAARAIAKAAKVDSHHVVLSLPKETLLSASPLLTPEAGLADARGVVGKDAPKRIEQTFVAMRNALFLTIAMNHALYIGCRRVYLGVSQEDYGGYPDCRGTFLDAFCIMAGEAIGESGIRPHLETPLLQMSKTATVQFMCSINKELPGAWDWLALSWTCYEGGDVPCGKCHACVIRARGFAEAGLPDPALESKS